MLLRITGNFTKKDDNRRECHIVNCYVSIFVIRLWHNLFLICLSGWYLG